MHTDTTVSLSCAKDQKAGKLANPEGGHRFLLSWLVDVPVPAKLTIAAALLSLLLASVTAAEAAYLQLKATLAQHLVESAWQQTLLSGGKPHPPWPWADTTPVARLVIDSANLDTHVLDGGSGTTLAFGPGRVAGSAEPGQTGTMVVGAHRDTHFSDLKKARTGDTMRLQDRYQQWHNYRITNISIADTRVDHIVADEHGTRLVLVTCYPFNALLPGGPLRYVVEAELFSEHSMSATHQHPG